MPDGKQITAVAASLRKVMHAAAIVAVCAFLVMWAIYRFSHAPIIRFLRGPRQGRGESIRRFVFCRGGSSFSGRAGATAGAGVAVRPARICATSTIAFTHVPTCSAGSTEGGWWYFYPVGITMKTPLGVSALALIGAIALVASWFRTRTDWQRVVPIVGFLAPIVIAAPSRPDIGVRHVMPVFAFLSILAAVGAVWLWNLAPRCGTRFHTGKPGMALWGGRAAVVVLLGWSVVSSALAHPDYLAYFNELGGKHPENILVISDLDWGQDLRSPCRPICASTR